VRRAVDARVRQQAADSGQQERRRESSVLRLLVCCLLSAVCCLRCNKDADEQLRKSAESWRSTLVLVRAEERKHNVSATVVKQVAELASKSLSKELKEPDLKPETRREAEAVVVLANEAAK
jgi:hypothetical protein